MTHNQSLRFRLTLVLTYGVGLWIVLLHHLEGGHESSTQPLLLHAFRDATLAFPAVFVATLLATRAAERLLRGAGASPRLEVALTAAFAGGAASAVFAAGVPVHAWLFGAHEATTLPLALHVARDFLLALFAALPLAAAAQTRRPEGLRVARTARLALGGLAMAALAGVAGAAVGAPASPGEPCPAGSPLKRFAVHAINVDIPINRFGDHDPAGKMYVLADRVADVRAQEASRKVSLGLNGDDAIQPLVIRANQGDCVEIEFTNNATGGDFGMHIDGLSFDVGSSGDAVGHNAASGVGQGGTITYRYFVPNERALEGAHYIRPGPTFRSAVSHGLFGVLSIEPPGSTYLDVNTGAPVASGWEASIVPGTGKPSFREFVQIYHEIGNEDEDIFALDGEALPTVDPHTDAYRPGTRAMNYRSEPFMNRLERNERGESHGYGSYTFGDPATPSMRGYLGDPTKVRLVHGGSELFHVFHLHGGGTRWRFNPIADTTYDYADTGLNKNPQTKISPSSRLDSQSFGPGETYNLEIEGGAGGVQQAAGDFLYHCHIASHYIGGMWAFWRVFDTLQPDMAPLPDRPALAKPVDSAGLIGRTMPNGTVITADNLDDWIRPQLPPQGVRKNDQDAAVWDWDVDRSDPARPIYLREPEDKRPWVNMPQLDPAHPGSMAVDLDPSFGGGFIGDRPRLLFNPTNGRPAYPLLRPHIGFRPPFSPNGHSGAPWLGEDANAPPKAAVDPYAGRPDGLCPQGAPKRRFNIVALTLPIKVTKKQTDPNGMLYTLAKDKAAVRGGSKPAEPLAIRANMGECVPLTFTSELTEASAFNGFSKVNMHIHHVQFDPQGADGVITGMQFEQSVRPYKLEDPTLAAAAAAGATTLQLSNVSKFQPGVWIGVGLGTEDIEIRQIESVDASGSTVTLTRALAKAHDAGEWAGVEFVQSRWFPDVLLDNVFWHDHVDGIHGWGHGLVAQLVVEPPGSTYHDPRTGDEVESGTIVDIRTSSPLVPGIVDGSFREFVMWQIDDNPTTDSTINLRAEPWSDRLEQSPDPSLLFSSYRHGDPVTPLPRAYPNDPFVVRAINAGPSIDGLHIDGHRFFLENRYHDEQGRMEGTALDTVPIGVSEKFTLVFEGGAGGPRGEPGDYLYMNTIAHRFRQGAWGLLRVLPGRVDNLQPLPGNAAPSNEATLPTQNSGRPPAAAGTGNPCPATASTRTFDVAAIDVETEDGPIEGAFVRGGEVVAREPLVLHAAVGECLLVRFTNRRKVRSSFHLGAAARTDESSGINAGFNPENTVLPGGTRNYRFYLEDPKLQSALISDFGGKPSELEAEPSGELVRNVEIDPAIEGVYGALSIAPAGATFTNPKTGAATSYGAAVDVHVPGTPGYRDFTLLMFEEDPRIGQNTMPYPTQVDGRAQVNYGTNRSADGGAVTAGSTPVLEAYAGDPVRVHAWVAPGSEQAHAFSLGGLSFPTDALIHDAEEVEARVVTPWTVVDAHIVGGAGGRARTLGDFWYGDLRRPFTIAGMSGIQRVLSPEGCPIKGLSGHPCAGATPSQPAVTLAPAAVAFGDQRAGTTSAAQTVTLTNSGSAPLSVTAISIDGANAADFAVTPGSCVGTLAAGGSCSIAVTFTPGALGARSATLQIASNAPGSPHAVPLSGTGVDGNAPLVAIDAPAAGATVSGTIDVTASASDDVAVTGVQFKLDGANLGAEDTTAPYSVSWNTTTVADGEHSLTAVARDGAGNSTTSAAVAVTVKNAVAPPPAPVVVLGEQTIKPSVDFNPAGMAEAFRYTAVASGTVNELKVYVDATATATRLVAGLYANNAGHPGARLTQGTLTTVTRGAWNTVAVPGASVTAGTVYWIAILGPSGSGTLRFRDACCGGGTAAETSAQTTLTGLPATWATGQVFLDGPASAYGVAGGATAPPPAPDTTAPTVSVTAPAAGATVSGSATLSASASDNVGVTGVQFKVDGANVGAEDTTAPYSVAWNTASVANGTHTVTAVARDAAGNSATSAAVSVDVSNTAPAPTTTLLGTQTILPSADANVAGLAEAFRVTAGASGTLSTLSVYVDAPTTATRLVAGVYADSAGHPGALLAQGTLDFVVKGAWNSVAVTPTAISAGTTYWIALLSPAGAGTLAFRDRCCGGGTAAEVSQQTTLTSLPATWTTGNIWLDGPASAYGSG